MSLSENYHSRLHTSTQPCYRTPSPITHSTLGLVSQCHHPCYHALLVRGGTLRDTTEGSVAPRPLVLAHRMEAHCVMPRGVTWYHASVISRGRDDTVEGVQ